MEMNWQQFGLRTNPYDTLPLVEGGDLSLDEAFIGREKDGIPVVGLMSADELEDYLELKDARVKKVILQSKKDIKMKRTRSVL